VCCFVYLTILFYEVFHFKPALWDHYTGLEFYAPNFDAPDFSVIKNWWHSLTTDAFVIRPTYSLITGLNWFLFKDDFQKWYAFKAVFYLATLLIIIYRLQRLNLSKYAVLLFIVLALSTPTNPMLMLFSADIYLAFFSILSFEILLLYLEAKSKKQCVLNGILALIIVFLAVGVKDTAPFLMILILISSIIISDTHSKGKLSIILKSIPFFLISAWGIWRVLGVAKDVMARGNNIFSMIKIWIKGFLNMMPLGSSVVILLFFLVIFFLYLYIIFTNKRLNKKCLFALIYIMLASFLLAVNTYALPVWSSTIIADRYLIPPALFFALSLAIISDEIFQYIKKYIIKIKGVFSHLYACCLLFFLLVGFSSLAPQILVYKLYFQYTWKNIDMVSSLAGSGQVVETYGIYGEPLGNLNYIFKKAYKTYNLTHYDLQEHNPLTQAITPHYYILTSGINLDLLLNEKYINNIKSIRFADTSSDKWLFPFVRFYNKIFKHLRNDMGTPWLIFIRRDKSYQFPNDYFFNLIEIDNETNNKWKTLELSNDKNNPYALLGSGLIRENPETVGFLIKGMIKPESHSGELIGINLFTENMGGGGLFMGK
jgi:hypothetical protein